jgi:hypothetical protein
VANEFPSCENGDKMNTCEECDKECEELIDIGILNVCEECAQSYEECDDFVYYHEDFHSDG